MSARPELAVRVASDLIPLRRHGGWFVDLVHVSDPAMVMATIAQIVGVPEQRSTPVDAALVATLAERDSLLVLAIASIFSTGSATASSGSSPAART